MYFSINLYTFHPVIVQDWLTNFTIVESDDLPLDECGGVAGATTHKGMLDVARDLKMRLLGNDFVKKNCQIQF